jgi:transposase InsO family protein
MDVRLVAAVSGDLEGVNISALARELGVSRKTIHKWAARYRAGGLAGLEPLSRRPHRSPGQLGEGTEDRIVELRKALAEEGLDAGPSTIRWHLAKEVPAPPSDSTIWRVLVRRGFVVPAPRKRPKRSLRRFEAAAPNECWQIDATEWHLADGTRVEIFNILDDHSRLAVTSAAATNATSEAAWAAFSGGVSRLGLPTRCLSDNGLCFSGRLRGFEVLFETNLRAAGIHPVTSRPFHPQTCGKVERFQQTLKKWLRARERAETLAELQAQLDTFCEHYNHHRPHRGIGRVTPGERFAAKAPAPAPAGPLAGPQQRHRIAIDSRGVAVAGRWHIAIGIEHTGRPALVVLDGRHANVIIDGELVRSLTLDPNRSYQPSGRPRGGPRRTRRP